MKRKLLIFILMLAISFGGYAQSATTWYVDKDVPTGDGSTWATAYGDLQAAIDAANGVNGDRIFVKKGQYDLATAITMKEGVKLYGSFAGTETTLADRDLSNFSNDAANATILKSSGSDRVINNNFTSAGAMTAASVLNSFVITGGNSEGLNNNNGGGINNEYASPTLQNLIIIGNIAEFWGGGIHNTNSSPTLTNVILRGNEAKYGGGIANLNNSYPTLTNVTISGNTAADGGAMYNYYSYPSISNCLIFGNTKTTGAQAGILNGNVAAPFLKYSLVQGLGGTSNGNISATGLSAADIFTDPVNGNYSLLYTSPAVNAGSNSLYTDAGGDLTNDVDLAGNQRIYDGLAATDLIDMGAYEFFVADQSITFEALADKTVGGDNFTLTAISDSGLEISYSSSNTSVASVTGNVVSIVGAGTTTITASQAGNNNYNAATSIERELIVEKAGQTIAFDPLANRTFGGDNFTLTATTDSGLEINYSSSNAAVATITSNVVNIVGVGTATITASQVGNDNFNAATDVAQELTVEKANQTITFNALANKTFGDADFTLSATTNSGLEISYISSNTAVATITSNVVNIVGAGTATIKASQAGNANYNAAEVTQELTVEKANQNITFNALANVNFGGPNFTLSATSNRGLSVSFASSDAGVATVSGNEVTIIGSGTTTITASQAGNANYKAASVAQNLTVIAAGNINLPDNETEFGVGSTDKSIVQTIQNTGNAPLEVYAINITGAANADFTVSGITFPVTIAAGESISYTLMFSPQANGVRSATVEITNNDPNTGTYTFDIQGTGINNTSLFAYVPNQGSNTVSVINTSTNTLVATIAVGATPRGVFVSPDSAKVYVANYGSNTVSVINTADNTVAATIGVGTNPTAVTVSPDGTKAYVSNASAGNVSIINTADNTVTSTVTVGNFPFGIAVSPDGSKVYVANFSSNSVSIIKTADNTVTSVGVGSGPFGLSASPNGAKVYVANNGSNTVSVINTADNSVTSIGVGGSPVGVSISPDGAKVYVANFSSNTVSVINTADNTVIGGPIIVGTNPFGLSASPDGTEVYVANYNSNNVSVINTADNSVTTTVIVGSRPIGFGNMMPIYYPPIATEINLQGNGNDIVGDDSNIPAAANNTEFGEVSSSKSIIYTIQNQGNAALEVSDITITGAANADFTVSGMTLPATIAAGGSTNFTLTFDPQANGVRDATVEISNTDADESTYIFDVQGTGINNAAGFAYVPNEGSNNVSVINTSTNTVVTTIAVGTTPRGAFVSPDSTKVYVSNYNSNTVSVIKTADNTVTATVAVGTNPYGLAVNPDGATMYVANSSSDDVSVINTADNTLTATVSVGTDPYGITVSPDGTKVYVSNYNSNTVSVMNTADNTVTASVVVGTNPFDLSISPDGKKVFVVNNGSNNLSIINTADNTVTDVGVGTAPAGVSASPYGTEVYVANFSDNTVSVINMSDNTLTATVAVGTGPFGLNVSTDGTKVYVANYLSNDVSVINTADNTVITTVAVGSNPVGFGSMTPIVYPAEINLQGNGNDIAGDDSTLPAAANATDFGDVYANKPVIYTIQNKGKRALEVSNINITGTDAADFAVSGISFPASIAAGASTSFTVTFTPEASVVSNATVEISNNDADEGTYTFDIKGTGISLAYVPNEGSDNVSVINISTNTVYATVAVGAGPRGLAVSPDGTKVYVANHGTNTVSVINTADNTVSNTVTVGSSPFGISVSLDGKKVYVANFNDNTVSVINTADNTVEATVPVGSFPISAAVSPDGTKVYVTNQQDNTVSVISTADNSVIGGPITVGASPFGLVVSPDGSKVYVSSIGTNNVSVINTADNSVTNLPVGAGSFGVSIHPDGTRLYATNINSGTVNVINISTETVVATVTVGSQPSGVSVSTDGTKVYVANQNPSVAGTVSVINTADNTVTATVTVGTTPYGFGNMMPIFYLIPEINIQGNGNDITSDGSNNISVANDTEFGEVTADKAITYTIQNQGNTVLEVSAINITGTDAADFAVSGITFPASIAAGASTSFTVTFTPQNNGVKNAALEITSNDPKSGTYTFAIQGTGLVDTAPSALALSNMTIEENNAISDVLGIFSSTDDVGDTHTYSLVSGEGDTDNASFAITASELTAEAEFDFESKSAYSIRVKTLDSDGLSFEQTFSISITDVNEAPTALAVSSSAIEENNAIGDVISPFSSTDADVADTHTYALVAGEGDTDNASFTITGSALIAGAVYDFESKSSYSIRVKTEDSNGLSFEQTFSISITDVNEAPTALALSSTAIEENNAISDVIGIFSSTDDVGDTHTYSLVAGEGDMDNASFIITSNDLLAGAVYDFEAKSAYSIRVKSEDDNGFSFEQTFTISITGVNEAPIALALSSNTIEENNAISDVIGSLSTTDVDAADTHTYSLVAGEGDMDNASFIITGNELVAGAVYDFEVKSTYSIRVKVEDSNGLSFEQAFSMTITDVNEVPTALTLSNLTIEENNALADVIGFFNTEDADAADSHSYTLVAGEGDVDNASFTLNGSDLIAGAMFDFEVKSGYSIRVKAEDSNGGSIEETFNITITDVNEAPTALALSNMTLDENNEISDVIGSFTTIDNVGDMHTYTLVAGEGDTDNASFTITAGDLTAGAEFDFETKSAYSIRVKTEDSNGGSFEQTFSITITDVNEAPTALALSNMSIEENNAIADVIGSVTTTDVDAADTHTYSLVSGEGDMDNASFIITGNELIAGAVYDFEVKSTYSIRVKAEDSNGLSFEQTFSITITDVNQAPTALALSNMTIEENTAIADVIGSFTTTDVDAADTHTYTLVSGEGDMDNASFTITADDLTAGAIFDFEAKSAYSIRVKTEDSNGLSFEQTFSISITDVDDTNPTVTITSAVTSPVIEAFEVTITFSEAVTGFTMEDLTFTNATASDFSGADDVYQVTITPIEPGTLSILVAAASAVDAAGNGNEAGNFSTEVSDPCANFSATLATTNVLCNGDVNGTIEVIAVGTAPFNYSLDGQEGQESNVFTGLAADAYEVTVTDANGCSTILSATLTQPELLTITAEVSNNTSILGNGSIVTTVSGGTGEYTYAWSNGTSSADVAELEVGEYTLIVTDENGCIATESFTIGGVTAARNEILSLDIYPNPTSDVLYIKHSSLIKSIRLYDVQEKAIETMTIESNEAKISLAHYPAGLYYMQIDGAEMHRFIKK